MLASTQAIAKWKCSEFCLTNRISGNNPARMGVCVNCAAVIMLLSGLLQLMKEMYGEGTPCSAPCAIPSGMKHLHLMIKAQLLFSCLMLKNSRGVNPVHLSWVSTPLLCPRQPWVGFGDVFVVHPMQNLG